MLRVENVKKSFGNHQVVQGVTFSVNKGESFGLLGPNGAGKSTLIAMISGLLNCDSGEIYVDGGSVRKKLMDVKKKIGVVPQEIALYPTMSARDNLIFWGKMYGLSSKDAKKKAEEVLVYVGLLDRAKDKVETFSGGMKRRINIGAALMNEPELLIMDEPTVGIDPQSRNHILETIKNLNANGMTVIYTSHYMEEVEYLCERIAIMDHGQLIALGTKADLCNRLADGTIVKLTVNKLDNRFLEVLKNLDSVEKIKSDNDNNEIEIYVTSSNSSVGEIITHGVNLGVDIVSFEVKEPNLESLFLQLTGRSLRE